MFPHFQTAVMTAVMSDPLGEVVEWLNREQTHWREEISRRHAHVYPQARRAQTWIPERTGRASMMTFHRCALVQLVGERIARGAGLPGYHALQGAKTITWRRLLHWFRRASDAPQTRLSTPRIHTAQVYQSVEVILLIERRAQNTACA